MKESLQHAADEIGAMDGSFEPYAEFLRLEAQAEYATYFNNSVLPGPLQNWTVAKAIIGKYHPEMADQQLEYLIDARAERGKYYAEGYLSAMFFVTEAVLDMNPIDESSWKIQLKHLVNMASKPHLALRIIPKDCFTMGEDMMTLLDLPGSENAVYFESDLRGDSLSRFVPAIEKVSYAFRDIGTLALDEAASIDLIQKRIDR